MNLLSYFHFNLELNFLIINSILSPVLISLKTAVTATIVTFSIGVFTAWLMANYQGKAKGLIDGILTAPLVLPPTVVGFLLLLALGKNGWIGRLLDLIGIQIIFTWYATVIAAVVVAFPLMYKTALAAFQQSSNTNLIACARTLGASETTIFWQIVLPLARSGLIAGTLLAFARALGEFGATLILAGSIPGKTQTIPIAIFFAAESGAMDEALGLVIILLCISLCAVAGVNYWQNKNDQTRQRSVQNNIRGGVSRGRSSDNWATGQIGDKEIQLEVDIQKQLPEFLLDVAFKISKKRTAGKRSLSPLGILGASGAGKSTLLKCIAGLETPDRGLIVLNNRVLFDSAKGVNLTPQERAVGLLFQDYALFPHLSVAENVAFGMSAHKSASAVKQEVYQQLEQVNLAHLRKATIDRLSGGEQQRVALARVLASEPNITLLDEPFSALDTDLKAQLLKLLQKQINNYGGLTLYVTHNLSQAYQLCPQLLVIERGKAIAFDSRQNIVNNPPNLKTAQITGCSNFSTAQKIDSQTIKALDWNCELKSDRAIPQNISHVAIRSQVITFVETNQGVNTFSVWLANHLELPDRVTLYLKFHLSSLSPQDYHLEASVTINQWRLLQQQACPYYVQLLPSQIIMFNA